MPPRERSYRYPRSEENNGSRPRSRFTPEDLQNWAFAIMIALFFVSCGAAAVVNVYGRWQGVSEKVEKAD